MSLNRNLQRVPNPSKSRARRFRSFIFDEPFLLFINRSDPTDKVDFIVSKLFGLVDQLVREPEKKEYWNTNVVAVELYQSIALDSSSSNSRNEIRSVPWKERIKSFKERDNTGADEREPCTPRLEWRLVGKIFSLHSVHFNSFHETTETMSVIKKSRKKEVPTYGNRELTSRSKHRMSTPD